MGREVPAGPPLVISSAWPKSWNCITIWITATSMIVPLIEGSVIRVSTRRFDALSSAAAS